MHGHELVTVGHTHIPAGRILAGQTFSQAAQVVEMVRTEPVLVSPCHASVTG